MSCLTHGSSHLLFLIDAFLGTVFVSRICQTMFLSFLLSEGIVFGFGICGLAFPHGADDSRNRLMVAGRNLPLFVFAIEHEGVQRAFDLLADAIRRGRTRVVVFIIEYRGIVVVPSLHGV